MAGGEGVGSGAVPSADRLAAARLESPRLVLEPLRPEHAEELAPVLADISLYRFTGAEPPRIDELRARFVRQARGRSPDGHERWLNWTVRRRTGGEAVGTVQATVSGGAEADPGDVAELAWVIGAAHQGQGLGTEAAQAMAGWLRAQGVNRLRAHVHPGHDASMGVAGSLGLRPTGVVVDGEVRWETPGPSV